MQKILSFLLFTIVFQVSYSQKLRKCNRCTSEIQSQYLEAFSNSEAKLKKINDNWKESFFEKIWQTEISQINGNVIPLRFDGIGCIYPEKEISNNLAAKFDGIFKNANVNNFDAISFFKLSENTYNSTKKQFWDEYLKIEKEEVVNIPTSDSVKFERQIEFYNQWNKYFLDAKINETNDKIRTKSIEKVVFILHGYNVPYSLASIQHENIIKLYSQKNDTSKVLFMPVYWPSTDFKDTLMVNKKFYFKNKIRIKTIIDYDKIMYRPLMIGTSIRQIINSISPEVKEIQMFSHSLGAGVVTGAIIPPIDFLKGEKSERYNIVTSLPFKPKVEKIRVFMNAPAIGNRIFNDLKNMDSSTIKKVHWFVGINTTDRVLARPRIVRILFHKSNDNTRLGANMFNETKKAKEIFEKLGISENFDYHKTGIQKDLFGHDFFCYLLQPHFIDQFEKFLKNN